MTLQAISDTLQDQLHSGKCQDLISLKKWLDSVKIEGWREMRGRRESEHSSGISLHNF